MEVRKSSSVNSLSLHWMYVADQLYIPASLPLGQAPLLPIEWVPELVWLLRSTEQKSTPASNRTWIPWSSSTYASY
jgi:hypothetical protein